MGWVLFFTGLFLGSLAGVAAMCLCAVSGMESRREEERERYEEKMKTAKEKR